MPAASIQARRTINEPSDAELAKMVRTDREAFGRLYDRHYRTILRYAFRRTLDMDVAEEITANTFLKALRSLPSYRAKRPFLAWLYRIASNELRMHWRHEKRHSPEREAERWKKWIGQVQFMDPEIADESEIDEAMKRFAMVSMYLLQLPDKYQRALTLRFVEGMSYQEVSEILDCRIGTVKSLIHRGLKRLRRKMEVSGATSFH